MDKFMEKNGAKKWWNKCVKIWFMMSYGWIVVLNYFMYPALLYRDTRVGILIYRMRKPWNEGLNIVTWICRQRIRAKTRNPCWGRTDFEIWRMREKETRHCIKISNETPRFLVSAKNAFVTVKRDNSVNKYSRISTVPRPTHCITTSVVTPFPVFSMAT